MQTTIFSTLLTTCNTMKYFVIRCKEFKKSKKKKNQEKNKQAKIPNNNYPLYFRDSIFDPDLSS